MEPKFAIIPTNEITDEMKSACDNNSYCTSPDGSKTVCRYHGSPSCFDSYELLTRDELKIIQHDTEVDFWNPKPDGWSE